MLLVAFQSLTVVPPTAVINAKDDQGSSLDCLKIVQRGRSDYLGVHHTLRDGRFELRLVSSRDLVHWKHETTLEDHAHQGYLKHFGKEWILASEKDEPGRGNWIRLRVYASDADLLSARPAKVFDLPTTLSKFAEGTPNIVGIRKGKSWDDSEIQLRFHYYRNGDVDRQAEGKLTNFSEWQCHVRDAFNAPLESSYHGNIGDRDAFTWAGQDTEWTEAQLRKEDWSSWRILQTIAGQPTHQLEFTTPGHSKSFANPNVTEITLPNGRRGLAITLFLPSQGNSPTEAGELIYFVPAQ